MPTPTYTALANVTLSAAATGISFASIPSTYRDLIVVVQAKADTATQQVRVTVNSDSSNLYYRQRMSGNGSAASAGSVLPSTQFQFTSDAIVGLTDGYNGVFNFLDYSVTNKHKSVLARSNNASAGVDAVSGRWENTAAITSIQVYSTGNLAAGSTFALYGIVA